METLSRTLMAENWVLDEARLSTVRGNHDGLWCLRLDGQRTVAVGLDQGVDRETLGVDRDSLGVHLFSRIKENE